MTYVTAKLGKMRKPQTFHVSPMSDGNVMIQSAKSIGTIDPHTGRGRLNTAGPYFPHLAVAAAFQFPAEFVTEVLDACPPMGSVTVLGGGVCTVINTIEVIG